MSYFVCRQRTPANCGDGNEIWVADGNYYPDEGGVQTPNDRGASFVLTEGVGVYGGFDSGETARIDRDWTLYEATLSGDINMPDSNDNSYHVVTGADRAVLDGFTITGGYASGSGANNDGAGIYCYQVSPTISNCVITDNHSFSTGGGMSNFGMNNFFCSPTITNCFFIDNSAPWGGGMFNERNCSPLITNCVFSGNEGGRRGGGIHNLGYSYPVLINCTFSGNVALTGGGMYTEYPFVLINTPTVTNCIFWGNTPEQIIGSTTVTYSDIQGGWPGTGNIDSDPCFVDINDPCGPDGIFGTLDDGLRLTIDSNCIDAADGNAARATDILGHGRIEVYNVDNNGIGEPNYADIGAYEFRDGGIVLMVWIDESTSAYHKSGGDVTFDANLADYRDLLNSGDLSIVQSVCLVPLPVPPEYGGFTTIEGILPIGYPYNSYDPPEGMDGIRIEECLRFPDEDEKVAQFNRIRDGVVPDYLLLSVDNSGSMKLTDIWQVPSQDWYDSFKARIKAIPGMADIVIAAEPRAFPGPQTPTPTERWVAEMTQMLQETIGN